MRAASRPKTPLRTLPETVAITIAHAKKLALCGFAPIPQRVFDLGCGSRSLGRFDSGDAPLKLKPSSVSNGDSGLSRAQVVANLDAQFSVRAPRVGSKQRSKAPAGRDEAKPLQSSSARSGRVAPLSKRAISNVRQDLTLHALSLTVVIEAGSGMTVEAPIPIAATAPTKRPLRKVAVSLSGTHTPRLLGRRPTSTFRDAPPLDNLRPRRGRPGSG